MSKPIDRVYYTSRIFEEHARAAGASDWAAAAVHRELAELHEELMAARDAGSSAPVGARP